MFSIGLHWCKINTHDDVMTHKHFLRYWLFARGIHQSHVVSPQKWPVTCSVGVFFAVIVWRISWTNNVVAGDLRDYNAHVMSQQCGQSGNKSLLEPTLTKITDLFCATRWWWVTVFRVHSNRLLQNSLTFPWHLPDSIHISLTKRNNKSVNDRF